VHPAELVALAQTRWPHIDIHCPPVDEAVARLSADIAERLRQAASARGEAQLCVSGGRSPVALFTALRAEDVPWSRVVVSLVDERCVPPDHSDSNARLVREHLLHGAAVGARFVPLIDTPSNVTPDLGEAAWRANEAVSALPVPDVTVLGMGTDGHTASWFPGSPDLAHALDMNTPLCVCAARLPEPPPQPPHPRLTLTLAHVLRSRHIVLPVQGAEKLAVLALAAQGLAAPNLTALPVSHVLHQRLAPVSLWLPF
jgi:6-phosphogluconolactonase